MTVIWLGDGILNWSPGERRSDRYGSVNLQLLGSENHHSFEAAIPMVGRVGSLVAEVLGPLQKSRHIGDLFRSIVPTTPQIGERIVLGEGRLWRDPYEAVPAVGLEPEDDRDTDWLDPHQLYKVHSQVVRLSFETSEVLK